MKMKCESDNFFKIYNEMQGVGVSVSKLKKREAKTHNYTYYICLLLICIFLITFFITVLMIIFEEIDFFKFFTSSSILSCFYCFIYVCFVFNWVYIH